MITNVNNNTFFVSVPKNSCGFEIIDNKIIVNYWNELKDFLPNGSFKIIGLINDFSWNEIKNILNLKSNQDFIDLIKNINWNYSIDRTLIIKQLL